MRINSLKQIFLMLFIAIAFGSCNKVETDEQKVASYKDMCVQVAEKLMASGINQNYMRDYVYMNILVNTDEPWKAELNKPMPKNEPDKTLWLCAHDSSCHLTCITASALMTYRKATMGF